MHIVLLNIAHPAIGSRVPDDHLPPLGLLMIGGALLDAGHRVELIDGDLENLSRHALVARAAAIGPEVAMFGHSGSSSAQPLVSAAARALRDACPRTRIVYGGVHPTYYWRELLASDPWLDAIVRGEGERGVVALLDAWERGADLASVAGLAFRKGGLPHATAPARMIADLESIRAGWELIDLKRYSYWGGRRAVVMQFSRGCPHPCTYCGQTGFWTRWRRRDPKKFAAEIAWLHRVHGVELINLADENPTSSRRAWKEFCEAMIAQNVPVAIVGSTRADDIVRDADLLPLYRKAGVIRWLMGTENTDEETLRLVKKGGATTKDREAIRLLRAHGMVSLATWVAGFQDETLGSLWRQFRNLRAADPDQIQALYVTPHRWTPFYREAAERRVLVADRTRWDYKHQVLATRLPAPVLFLAVKLIEVAMQTRPKALYRTFLERDPERRHAMRWYARIGRRVWFREVFEFLRDGRRLAQGPTLAALHGAPQDGEAMAHALAKREAATLRAAA